MAGFSSLQNFLIYNLLDKEFLARSVSFPEEIDEIPENMERFCRLVPEDLKIQIRPILQEFQRCIEAQQIFLETAEKHPQLALFLLNKFKEIRVSGDAVYACFAHEINNGNYKVIRRFDYLIKHLDAHQVSELLMLGIKKGNEQSLNFLLSHFIKFLSETLFFDMLNRASEEGKFEIVKYLIKELPSYSRSLDREDHFMLLHKAAKSGNSDLVRYLIETFQLDINSEDGRETVLWAARSGNIDLMKYLIKALHMDARAFTLEGKTLLYFAAESGNLDMVKYLVEQCGLEIKDEDDEPSILNCAYEGGNFEVLSYLYHNPSISIQNRDQKIYAILRRAAIEGNSEFFQIMAEKLKLDINFIDIYGRSLLFYAIKSKSAGLVRSLLLSPQLNDKIIHEAVMDESFWKDFLPGVTSNNEEMVELVKFLVERRNLDVNRVSCSGCSLLDMALLAKNVELVAYLFSYPGLDTRLIESLMTNRDFMILLLQEAAKNKKLFEFVRFLIERYRIDLKFFASVEGEGTFLQGALFFGIKYKYLGLFKYLVEVCHLDVNQVDKRGRTALHLAAIEGSLEAVKYLVENCNTNINAVDGEGLSVLDFESANVSSNRFNIELVKYLIECPQLSVKISYKYFKRLVLSANKVFGVYTFQNTYYEKLAQKNLRVLFETCDLDKKLFINEENKSFTFLQLVLYLSDGQDIKFFEYLIRNCHFDVNFANQEGLTIFHLAFLLENWMAVHLLAEVYQDRINLNAVDREGRTIAHCASIGKSLYLLGINELRGARFEVNSYDNKGFTPLHYAAQRGDLEGVQWLIESFNANVDIVSEENGVTVFQLACESGNRDLIEYLKRVKEPRQSALETPIIEEEKPRDYEDIAESKELKQELVALSAERETFAAPEEAVVTAAEELLRDEPQGLFSEQTQKSPSLCTRFFLPAMAVIGALLSVSSILLNSNEK